MKTNLQRAFPSMILLGLLMAASGCRTATPLTLDFRTSKESDRTVLSVCSPVPTEVECAWRQDGARIRHRNTTPFRLLLPGECVRELNFAKPTADTAVAVEIQPSSAKPCRFEMEPGASSLRLVWDGHWLKSSGQGS